MIEGFLAMEAPMHLRIFVPLAVMCALIVVPATSMAADTVESGVIAAAEVVSLAADRPGFGDATSVVPPWRFALEVGTALETSEEVVALEMPLALLRMGILSWLEARLLSPGVAFPFGEDDTPKATNGAAGFKIAFTLHEQIELSWVSMFAIPVEELAAGESAFEYATTVNFWFGLSDAVGFALTGAGTFHQPIGSEDDTLLWETGGALAVVGTLEDTGIYLEMTTLVDQDLKTTMGAGVGVTQMITDRLQVDLFFDYGRPESATSIVVGAGVATLF